ncbi:hypothetical protein CN984_06740 [Bacillus cereus]|uniref:Uncharacterized protein n=1 Tax=Bacillus cereus TaxID=1396 RepID=A0A2B9QCJ4_BACCE|nr:hypothetical protein CN984_06740 [Bacillus cereus]
MNEHGTSIRETAALFNIPSYETLHNWAAFFICCLACFFSKCYWLKGDKKIRPITMVLSFSIRYGKTNVICLVFSYVPIISKIICVW